MAPAGWTPVVRDGLQRTAAQVATELHRSEAAVQRWDGDARAGLTLIVFLVAGGPLHGQLEFGDLLRGPRF